jgi:hypothetical protein
VNIRKNLDKKKLFPRVVGANDILIYYPEHDKNYDVHHKKNLLKKTYMKKKFKQKI